MREENQLRIILSIIGEYKLNEPLSRFLKKYYREHPNMGSRDRASASSFIYNYFRLGKALQDADTRERLLVGSFLSSDKSNPLLKYLLENFSSLKEEELQLPLKEKIKIAEERVAGFSAEDVFPFAGLLSDEIDAGEYSEAFFCQPLVWIRVRREKAEEVKKELIENSISFTADEENPLALSFPNATSLTKLPSFEKGYFEIQDWASQQTLKHIPLKENECWWDACAGSGGKSLMLFDAEPSVKIIATDTRPSIIDNLRDRFRKAGLKNYEASVVDLTQDISKANFPVETKNISGIIADVPCSGSGTWARSPEWITMFDEKELDKFQALQRQIVENLVSCLKPGMPLIYITCSVFKKENEENVDYFTGSLPLELIECNYVNGIQHRADTLFVARMICK